MEATGPVCTDRLDSLQMTRSWTRQKRIAAAGACFQALAVLCLIYAANVVLRGDGRNILALGTTCAFATQFGGADVVFAVIISCGMAGLFAVLGLFAERAEKWACIAGLAVYCGDALLLVYQHNYGAAIFHALAIMFGAMGVPRVLTRHASNMSYEL